MLYLKSDGTKKLTTSVLICVNPQAFLLWNAWKVKNWFMWTTHLTYYIKYIFQNGSLQSPWNRRAYLGFSREAKAESVIRLLSSFKHGQEGAGEGPIILKDLSGQCWERSHATQRKPDLWSIKSGLLHFCSLVLTWHILLHAHHAWNHTSSIFKHTVKGSPIHLPQKKQLVIASWASFSHDLPSWKSLTAPPISTPNSASHRWWNPGPACSQSCPRRTVGMWALSPEQISTMLFCQSIVNPKGTNATKSVNKKLFQQFQQSKIHVFR